MSISADTCVASLDVVSNARPGFGGGRKPFLSRSKLLALLSLAVGWFVLIAPATAFALPTCNLSITVNENSSNNVYILHGTPNPAATGDIANCDPGFSGISPGVQSSTNGVSGLGSFYSPNHGGSHRFETTLNDDRVTYTPAANFVGTETVGACGEPGTTNCGTITFTVLPVAPSVTSISPTSGGAGGGTSVTITGTALTGATNVFFGGVAATSFTVNSGTSITATAPAHAAGTVDVTVVNTAGSSTTSAADHFTYIATPTVSSISPTTGPTAGGTTVTITGTNLTGATAVKFGATNATGFTINSATQITATAPAGTGTVDVRVTTGGGTSATGASDQYTYAAAPTVSSISPTSGSTLGGSTVTITGTNFTGVSAVSFGATPASSFTFNSATSITATAPAGTGTVDVRVTTPGGTSATSGSDQFTYVAIPTVTSISPTSGPAAGGTSVTLTGTNFSGVFAVAFGATPASSFTVNSATSITATAPAGTGTVDVTVTALTGGTSATSAADQFTYVAAPVITGVSPTSGPTGGGTGVTITGTNFTGATAVSFGGSAAASFTVNSATSISATSPAHSAATVDIRVTTGGGTSATSASDQFTFNAILLSPSSPLTAATVGAAYSNTISASGGAGGYSFAVTAGALPAGLSLASNGALTGTPTAGGSFNFTVTATDSGSATGSQAYALTVNAPTIAVSPSTLPGGTVGSAYSQAVSASGGTSTYSFAVTAGALPAGLSLNATTGVVSGTPTAGGTFNFTITATDSSTGTGPFSGSRAYSLVMAAPTITVGPNFPPNMTTATPYSQTFTASGGTSTYTFAVTSGAIPAGMTLSTAGVLSGTPTEGGTFNFTITATDSSTGTGPFTGSHAYTLVSQAATVSTSPTTLPNGTVAAAYSQTVSGTGGTAPYTFQITGGALPAGLSLNASTGVVSGTPTQSGAFTVFIIATDSSTGTGPFFGGRSYSFNIAAPTVAVAPGSLPNPTVGVAYSQTVSGSGGTAPYSFAVTAGALPAGLSLASDGTLSGTATAAGSFNFTITATDSTTGSGPYTASKAYSVTVAGPSITLAPTSLTAGSVGTAFSQSVTASGGTGPYSYAVTAGALPAGLSLNSSTGAVTGTPTAGGSFNFTVTATDSTTGTGAPFTGARAYSLTINAPTITVSPTTAPSATVGSAYSQTFTGSGGTSTYSFAVTAGALPAGLSLASNGALTGTPTAGGTFNFTVTATDSSTGTGPYTGSRAYTLTVNAPTIVVSPTTLSALTQGVSTNQTISASGGTSSYSFAVTAGTLPTGLSLSSAGALTGAPSGSGAFSFTVTATDSSTGTGSYTGSRAYSGTIAASPPVASSFTAATATYNTGSNPTFAIDLSAHATNTPTGYVISPIGGVTQGGVSPVSSSNAQISFTPAVGFRGNDQFQYVASNTGGSSSTATVTVTVGDPTLSISRVGSGTVGAALSGVSITTSGGRAPYSYVLASGALPAGVTLNSNGTLSGTPTAAGTFNFTVTATDSSIGPSGAANPFSQASGALTLTIAAPTIVVSPTILPAAAAGAAYSQTVTASGGTASYSFAVTAGALPAGLSLASNGALTGTPTAGGTFNFTVTATDSSTGTGAPFTGSRVYTLTVGAATITLSPTSLSAITQGISTSQTISASGGTASYSFAVTGGTLPTGLSLSSAGALTGTSSVSGPYSFTVTATDSSTGTGPFTGSHLYSGTIAAGIPTAGPKSVTTAYNTAVPIDLSTVITGVSASSVTVASGPSHGGTSVSGLVVTYTPTAGYAGPDSFTYTATGPGGVSGPATVSITVSPPTIVVAPTTLANPQVGVGYNAAVSASGGATPYSYAVTTGGLPTGLSLNASTGAISGTPTAGGTFSFTITATDSSTGTGPFSAAQAYSVTVAAPAIVFTPSSLPAGAIAAAYSQPVTASGGTAPYSYQVLTGALPAGLRLNPTTGAITGTPTAGGSFNFTVQATDSSTGAGAPYAAVKAYSLTIAAPTITLTPSTVPAANAGTAYSQSLTASGGTAGYNFALTAGALPTGMTLSAAGVLSGTPTAGGTFNFTVTATDHSIGTGPYSGSQAYSLTVNAAAITVTPASLAGGMVAQAYSQSVSASGGVGAYHFAVTSGSLPVGLSLNASTGAITGTPTAGGTFPVTITATDSASGSGPFSGSQAYSLVIAAPHLTLTPSVLASAQQQVPYSANLSASGGTGPYAYAVTAGALPTGLSLSSAGVLSGTPGASGVFHFTVTATDSSTGSGPYSVAQAYAFSVAAAPVSVTPSSIPSGTVGQAYSAAITGAGGTGPYTVAITSGALPAGLSLSSSGAISGTPTAGGSFSLTFLVTDSTSGAGGPYTASKTYGLTINAPTLTLAPGALPTGQQQVAYSQTLSASGGTAPYSFAVTAGALPAGITLTSAGVLAGTPTVFGTFNFTVTGTDSSTGSGPYAASHAYALTINPPAAPTAAAASASTPFNTLVNIDLTSSITGAATGITLTTAVTHGSTSVSGKVVTYTPADGFIGTDGFDYTAQGPGGASAPAHVTITVAAPPAPVAAAFGPVTVAYNSSGQAIDLTSRVTGLSTSIAISTAPAHGTAVVTNGGSQVSKTDQTAQPVGRYVVTYTPAPGYAGADSFSYTATGPGGTSAPAAVSINVFVAAPVAVAETATTPANQAVTINAGANDTGVITALNVTTPPAHGTATVNGLSILYTPAANYFGADSFAYAATGPGGTSAPVTDTISVTATPPVASPVSATDNVTSGSGGTITIHIPPPTTGGDHGKTAAAIDYTVNIVTPPAHGTAVVSGHDILYTPNPGYVGLDAFTYSITTIFGTSAPATVSVTITSPPTAQNFTATTAALTPVTVDVTSGALNGPITAATVVSVSPSGSGTATAASTGTAGHFAITFTPSTPFAGTAVITFTLSNASGASAPATLTVTVQPRPNPALDPDVKGLIGAQDAAARRFAQAQIANFNGRLEQLHQMGGTDGGEGGYAPKSSFGLTLGLGDYSSDQQRNDNPAARMQAEELYNPAFRTQRNTYAGDRNLGSGPSALAATGASGEGRQTLTGGTSVWVAGTIDLGQRHLTPGQEGVKFQSSGVSLGLDRQMGEHFVLGVGAGWGHSDDKIGDLGSKSRADNWVGAVYGSLNPVSNLYIDGVVGYGGLTFDSTRHTAGNMVTGTRDGTETFGSLTMAWEHRSDTMHLSPYGRLDMANATLKAFTETGDPVWALSFGEQKVNLLTGSLGLHGDWTYRQSWGAFSPRYRMEYRHEFDDVSSTSLRYADLTAGTVFNATPNQEKRDNVTLSAGGEWRMKAGWTLSLDWEGLVSDSNSTDNRVLLKFDTHF